MHGRTLHRARITYTGERERGSQSVYRFVKLGPYIARLAFAAVVTPAMMNHQYLQLGFISFDIKSTSDARK